VWSPHESPVGALGGCTTAYADQWAASAGEDSTEAFMVRTGVSWPMEYWPYQQFPPTEKRFSAEESAIIDEEIDALYSRDSIELCADDEESCESEDGWSYGGDEFFSRLSLAFKKDGAARLCFNARRLNRATAYRKFKQEGLGTARELLEPGDWMASVDLSKAYEQFLIKPSWRRALRFHWRGQAWQWRVLPFGVSLAPFTFTRFIKVVVAALRKKGIRMVQMLDDSLILGRSRDECRDAVTAVLDELARHGLRASLKKSQLEPAQEIVFLGMQINSVTGCVTLPEEKKAKLKRDCVRLARRCRSDPQSVTGRHVASIVGKLQATSAAVFGIRVRMLSIIEDFRRDMDTEDLDAQLTLSEESIVELETWAGTVDQWEGRAIWTSRPEELLDTDASGGDGGGWGVYLYPTTRHPARWIADRFHEELLEVSSNHRELTAAIWGVQSMAEEYNWRNITVLLRVDNTVSMFYINNGKGGKTKALNVRLRSFVDFCRARRLHVIAQYLPGPENYLADALSRRAMRLADAMLKRAVFGWVNTALGPATVDLFATVANTQLPRFVSWSPSVGAVARDALRQQWDRPFPGRSAPELLYAFPPMCLLGRVLKQAWGQGADMVLIAPLWPGRPWWPRLIEMMIEPPLVLPEDAVDVPASLQPGSRWIAVRISGGHSNRKGMTPRLSTWCLSAGRTGATSSTTRAGSAGSSSASRTASIRIIQASLISVAS